MTDPEAWNLPDRATLAPADTAALAQALLALTREVWVLTDRMLVTEAVLAERGIDLAGAIERHQPDAALQARLDAAGARLAAAVTGALGGVVAD